MSDEKSPLQMMAESATGREGTSAPAIKSEPRDGWLLGSKWMIGLAFVNLVVAFFVQMQAIQENDILMASWANLLWFGAGILGILGIGCGVLAIVERLDRM